MFRRKKGADAISTADKKAAKADKKSGRKAARTDRKATATSAKATRKATEAALAGTLLSRLTDPKMARRAVSAAKIAGPALAPFALRTSTQTRGYLDQRRASRLGVSVEALPDYRGPVGATLARIDGLERSLEDLRRRRGQELQVTRFVQVSRARLADLSTATRSAASQPPATRRGTLHAVGRELGRIENDLLTFLVGDPA